MKIIMTSALVAAATYSTINADYPQNYPTSGYIYQNPQYTQLNQPYNQYQQNLTNYQQNAQYQQQYSQYNQQYFQQYPQYSQQYPQYQQQYNQPNYTNSLRNPLVQSEYDPEPEKIYPVERGSSSDSTPENVEYQSRGYPADYQDPYQRTGNNLRYQNNYPEQYEIYQENSQLSAHRRM